MPCPFCDWVTRPADIAMYENNLTDIAHCSTCGVAGFQASLQVNQLWPIAHVTRYMGLGSIINNLESFDPKVVDN